MPLQVIPNAAQFQLPGMRDVSSGAEAEARMWETGVGAASNVGEVLQTAAANRAKMSGALAGAQAGSQYDPDGNLLPLTTLPSDQSLYSQAFREQAISIYASAAAAQGRSQARLMALDPANQSDPNRFRSQWNAYTEETLGKVHPMVAGALRAQFGQAGAEAFGNLADNYVKATQTDAEAGLLTTLHADKASIIERVTAMGDTPGARQYLAEQLQSLIGPVMLQLHGALPMKYGPGELTKLQDGIKQELASAMIQGEVQKYGAQLKQLPDGTWAADKEGAAAYLAKVEGDPAIAGLYGAGEFKSMVADPAMSRFSMAETQQKSALVANTVKQDAAIGGQVGQLTADSDKAFAQWDATFDNAGLLDVEKRALNQTFDSNPAQSIVKRNAFLNDLNKKVLAAWTDPNKREEMRLTSMALDGATTAASGIRFPDSRAGTQALNRIQMVYDARTGMATGDPAQVLSSTLSPDQLAGVLYDPKQGFIAKTGRIPPRFVQEMSGSLTNYSPQQATNIYNNYRQLILTAPDEIKNTLGQDGMANMQAWGDAGGDPAAYTRLRALQQGGQALTSAENTAKQTLDNFAAHPEAAGQTMVNGIAAGLQASSTIMAGARSLLGLPPEATAQVIPDAYKEGWFGLSVPGGDWGRRALGYSPLTVRVNYSPTTEGAWKDAMVEAGYRGFRDQASAASYALSTMADKHYAVSKLLMPSGVDVGGPGQWRDMTGDFTYGQYGPEDYYHATALDIAHDTSLGAAQWAKDPRVFNAYKSADPLIVGDMTALGAPDHWMEEYTQGRMKLDPVMAGGQLAGYNVLGMVQNKYGYQWIQLNPEGQPYKYDAMSGYAAKAKLVGAETARGAGLAAGEAVGGGTPGALVGAGVAAGHHWAVQHAQSESEMLGPPGAADRKIDSLMNSIFGPARPGGPSSDLSQPPSDILKLDESNKRRNE